MDQRQKNLKGAKNTVHFLGKDGRSYYSAYKDGKVRVWDGSSHKEIGISKKADGKKGDRAPSQGEIKGTALKILNDRDEVLKQRENKNQPAEVEQEPKLPTPKETSSKNFGDATKHSLEKVEEAGNKFDAQAAKTKEKKERFYEELLEREKNFGTLSIPKTEEPHPQSELTEGKPQETQLETAPKTEGLFSGLYNRFFQTNPIKDTGEAQTSQPSSNLKANSEPNSELNLNLLKSLEHTNTHKMLNYKSKEAEQILNKVEGGQHISPDERLFLDKWLADINRGTKKEIMHGEINIDLDAYRKQEQENLEKYGQGLDDWNTNANKDYGQNLARIDDLSTQERSRQEGLLGQEGQVGNDDFYKTLKSKMLENMDADKQHREAFQKILEEQQGKEDFILDKKIAGKGLFGTPMDNDMKARGGALTPEKQMQMAMMQSAGAGKYGDMYSSLANADVAMNHENQAGKHKLSNAYGDIHGKQLSGGENANKNLWERLKGPENKYNAQQTSGINQFNAGKTARGEQMEILNNTRQENKEDVESSQGMQKYYDDKKSEILRDETAANLGDSGARIKLIETSNTVAQNFLNELKQINVREIADNELQQQAKEWEDTIQIELTKINALAAQGNTQEATSKAGKLAKSLLSAGSAFLAAGGPANLAMSIPAAIVSGGANYMGGDSITAADQRNANDALSNWYMDKQIAKKLQGGGQPSAPQQQPQTPYPQQTPPTNSAPDTGLFGRKMPNTPGNNALLDQELLRNAGTPQYSTPGRP